MSGEVDILRFVCQKLEEADIPYMLTGSWAANFYAVPRMTRDIDFVIEILNPKVDRFFNFFQTDFYVDKESIEDLIVSKLFWAKDSLSELQLKDVRNLLLSIKNLDEIYISHWVQRLKLDPLYEKVKTNE